MGNCRIKTTSFTQAELERVAQLHAENIDQGFISSLGNRFLLMLYGAIQAAPGGILVVCYRNGVIAGFVAGSLRIGPVYKVLLLRNHFFLFFVLLGNAFSFRKIKRIWETFSYSAGSSEVKEKVPSMELLSLVVDPRYRRQRVAKMLCAALEEEFYRLGANQYKIMVGAKLTGAQSFYESLGARKEWEITVHAGETSWVYLKKIERQ